MLVVSLTTPSSSSSSPPSDGPSGRSWRRGGESSHCWRLFLILLARIWHSSSSSGISQPIRASRPQTDVFCLCLHVWPSSCVYFIFDCSIDLAGFKTTKYFYFTRAEETAKNTKGWSWNNLQNIFISYMWNSPISYVEYQTGILLLVLYVWKAYYTKIGLLSNIFINGKTVFNLVRLDI